METWHDLQERTSERLRALRLLAPEAEARWMVEQVSGYEGAELIVGGDEPATAAAAAHVDDMIERRAAGEPLQYVLGTWQFRGVDLLVDRRVLVPRPETEVVAGIAIDEAVRRGAHRGRSDAWAGGVPPLSCADLGTGSGAIALALVSELRDVTVWATDSSEDALEVARANLAGTGAAAARVRLAGGSWFDALPDELRGTLALVVSNPPYVADYELIDLPRDVVDWEPYEALVSGPTGLEAIEAVIDGALEWLDPTGGSVVLELAPHQAEAATARAHVAGFKDVSVRVDLTGRDRVLVARAEG